MFREGGLLNADVRGLFFSAALGSGVVRHAVATLAHAAQSHHLVAGVGVASCWRSAFFFFVVVWSCMTPSFVGCSPGPRVRLHLLSQGFVCRLLQPWSTGQVALLFFVEALWLQAMISCCSCVYVCDCSGSRCVLDSSLCSAATYAHENCGCDWVWQLGPGKLGSLCLLFGVPVMLPSCLGCQTAGLVAALWLLPGSNSRPTGVHFT